MGIGKFFLYKSISNFSTFYKRIMLTKVFMEKEKKVINVLTVFFISHKSDVKIFFNWIFNQYFKGPR